MKKYKELKKLYDWLGFFIWVNRLDKANNICKEIDSCAKGHPIIRFFASFN